MPPRAPWPPQPPPSASASMVSKILPPPAPSSRSSAARASTRASAVSRRSRSPSTQPSPSLASTTPPASVRSIPISSVSSPTSTAASVAAPRRLSVSAGSGTPAVCMSSTTASCWSLMRRISISAPTTSWSARRPSRTEQRRSWSGCLQWLACRMTTPGAISSRASWPGSCSHNSRRRCASRKRQSQATTSDTVQDPEEGDGQGRATRRATYGTGRDSAY